MTAAKVQGFGDPKTEEPKTLIPRLDSNLEFRGGENTQGRMGVTTVSVALASEGRRSASLFTYLNWEKDHDQRRLRHGSFRGRGNSINGVAGVIQFHQDSVRIS